MIEQQLLQLLYTVEKRHEEMKHAQNGKYHKIVRGINALLEENDLTEQQVNLVHAYVEKAEKLEERYQNKAEDVLEPYAERIFIGAFSLPAAVGAAAGYAYVLAKSYLTGETEDVPVLIGALAGVVLEVKFKLGGKFIIRNIPAAQKVMTEYAQEKKKLISSTLAELVKEDFNASQ